MLKIDRVEHMFAAVEQPRHDEVSRALSDYHRMADDMEGATGGPLEGR